MFFSQTFEQNQIKVARKSHGFRERFMLECELNYKLMNPPLSWRLDYLLTQTLKNPSGIMYIFSRSERHL